MADQTRIEWSDATWNPLAGCTHVSPGCDHCYAAREASGRLSGLPLYAGLAQGGKFTGEVRLVPERLDQPLRWRRPRRIFVNSMSDLFHDSVPDEFIAQVFRVMGAARRHTFQLLTKRHARMRSLLSSPDFDAPWPLRNVWLGVSAENQQWADIRIPALLETPAAVRWVSAEPLLGPIDLRAVPGLTGQWGHNGIHTGVGTPDCPSPLHHHHDDRCRFPLDWVVVGGESGLASRPMTPGWARSLRDQCVSAGVPFLFKQWGGRTPKANGRELDGRTWDEYPKEASHAADVAGA